MCWQGWWGQGKAGAARSSGRCSCPGEVELDGFLDPCCFINGESSLDIQPYPLFLGLLLKLCSWQWKRKILEDEETVGHNGYEENWDVVSFVPRVKTLRVKGFQG